MKDTTQSISDLDSRVDTIVLDGPRRGEWFVEIDDRPMSEPRAFENRLVGCCRDFALVACAILREQGTPARLRQGFAGYFIPNYWIDHVIVETCDHARWRRFDPEMPATN